MAPETSTMKENANADAGFLASMSRLEQKYDALLQGKLRLNLSPRLFDPSANDSCCASPGREWLQSGRKFESTPTPMTKGHLSNFVATASSHTKSQDHPVLDHVLIEQIACAEQPAVAAALGVAGDFLGFERSGGRVEDIIDAKRSNVISARTSAGDSVGPSTGVSVSSVASFVAPSSPHHGDDVFEAKDVVRSADNDVPEPHFGHEELVDRKNTSRSLEGWFRSETREPLTNCDCLSATSVTLERSRPHGRSVDNNERFFQEHGPIHETPGHNYDHRTAQSSLSPLSAAEKNPIVPATPPSALRARRVRRVRRVSSRRSRPSSRSEVCTKQSCIDLADALQQIQYALVRVEGERNRAVNAELAVASKLREANLELERVSRICDEMQTRMAEWDSALLEARAQVEDGRGPHLPSLRDAPGRAVDVGDALAALTMLVNGLRQEGHKADNRARNAVARAERAEEELNRVRRNNHVSDAVAKAGRAEEELSRHRQSAHGKEAVPKSSRGEAERYNPRILDSVHGSDMATRISRSQEMPRFWQEGLSNTIRSRDTVASPRLGTSAQDEVEVLQNPTSNCGRPCTDRSPTPAKANPQLICARGGARNMPLLSCSPRVRSSRSAVRVGFPPAGTETWKQHPDVSTGACNAVVVQRLVDPAFIQHVVAPPSPSATMLVRTPSAAKSPTLLGAARNAYSPCRGLDKAPEHEQIAARLQPFSGHCDLPVELPGQFRELRTIYGEPPAANRV